MDEPKTVKRSRRGEILSYPTRVRKWKYLLMQNNCWGGRSWAEDMDALADKIVSERAGLDRTHIRQLIQDVHESAFAR